MGSGVVWACFRQWVTSQGKQRGSLCFRLSRLLLAWNRITFLHILHMLHFVAFTENEKIKQFHILFKFGGRRRVLRGQLPLPRRILRGRHGAGRTPRTPRILARIESRGHQHPEGPGREERRSPGRRKEKRVRKRRVSEKKKKTRRRRVHE